MYWFTNPMLLLKDQNYLKFIPKPGDSREQKINSLTLFIFYLAIVFFAVYGYNFILILILVSVIIVSLTVSNTNDVINQEELVTVENKKMCTMPTENNPFMNVTIDDYINNPNRPAACVGMKEETNTHFFKNIFRDVDDLYEKGYGQHQFYTTPNTKIPNDQDKLAKWLYKMPETCKENQFNCLKYEDIRYKRFNPNIDIFEKQL